MSNIKPILDQFSNGVEKELKNHEENLLSLGNEFTRVIITPFCKKNKLNFYSGNGTFFFSKESKAYTSFRGEIDLSYSDRECSNYTGKLYRKLNLDIIFSILNIEITSHVSFGSYCCNVKTF